MIEVNWYGTIGTAQINLAHHTTGSGTEEHPPPREFENELTREEIRQREDLIRELDEAGVVTTEIHKILQKGGKRLGEQGQQMVSAGYVLSVFGYR